jgi:excisionase family DNA binding protein
MAAKVRTSLGKEARLLTVRQAAEYLGTTPSTLYSKIWRREVPFIKWGRSVRFDIVDLDELITKSKVVPQEFPALRDGFQRKK